MRRLDYPYTMLRIAPSIRCNFESTCTHCTHFAYHKNIKEKTRWKEVPPETWLKHLNRLKPLRHISVILGVGEPSLYRGIEKIVNGLNVTTGYYTNASDLAMEKIRKFTPRKTLALYVSFHPAGMSVENFIENAKWLQNTFNIMDFHSVPYPGREEELVEAKKIMAEQGVNLCIDHPFTGWADEKLYFYDNAGGDQGRFRDRFLARNTQDTKDVFCKVSANHYMGNMSMAYPIAPNGDIYVCWRYMLAGSKEGILGNLFDESFEYNDDFFECSKYGDCNICGWDRNIIDKKTGQQLDCDTIARVYI